MPTAAGRPDGRRRAARRQRRDDPGEESPGSTGRGGG